MHMLPKILIAADHGGFARKEVLKKALEERGFIVQDCGPSSLNPNDDYPMIVAAVAKQMADEAAPQTETRAILLCRSGAGMTMAANRYAHLRAVTAFTDKQAQQARIDEDANVLSLSAEWLEDAEILQITEAFLATPRSSEPRHQRRIAQLTVLGEKVV